MPQLNGGGGDDLGANDEMIPFKDEGEQEEKISENVSAERDLDDVKSSLVNESENNSSSSDSEVNSFFKCAQKQLVSQCWGEFSQFAPSCTCLAASREAPPNQTRLRKL